jgi:hypothetical protein
MHDWENVIRQRLRILRVCPTPRAEELVGELASHLEDSYEDSLRNGLPPDTAFHHAVVQIERRSRICLTLRVLWEVLMTDFARKVGLPGLLTFASAMVIAWVLDLAHIQPKTIFMANGLYLSLPAAWLCLVPICGAVGVFVSHRSGGSRLQRVAACLFPSAIMGAVLLLIFVAGFAISRFVPDSGWDWALVVPGLALWLTGSAILPAIPLLAGAAAGEQLKKIWVRAV